MEGQLAILAAIFGLILFIMTLNRHFNRKRGAELIVRRKLSREDVIIGCSGLAGIYRELDPILAKSTVHQCLQMGFRSFDTAPHYGLGLSEERLGEALLEARRKGNRKEPEVWTKVGRLIHTIVSKDNGSDSRSSGVVVSPELEPHQTVEVGNLAESPGCIFPATPPDRAPVLDYTARGVRESWRQSLHRLGVPAIFGLRLHDCESGERFQQAMESGIDELIALKEGGKVKQHPKAKHLDTVMMAGAWNLLDQSGYDVLSHCERNGIQVHLAGVYASGLLVGGTMYNYMKAPPEIIQRTQDWQSLAERYGKTLPQLAIAFACLPSVVDRIAIGVKNVSEAELILDAMEESQAIPMELWEDAKLMGLLPHSLKLQMPKS